MTVENNYVQVITIRIKVVIPMGKVNIILQKCSCSRPTLKLSLHFTIQIYTVQSYHKSSLRKIKILNPYIQYYSANIVQSTDINAIYELNHNYMSQINKVSCKIQYILFNTTHVNQNCGSEPKKKLQVLATGIHHPNRVKQRLKIGVHSFLLDVQYLKGRVKLPSCDKQLGRWQLDSKSFAIYFTTKRLNTEHYACNTQKYVTSTQLYLHKILREKHGLKGKKCSSVAYYWQHCLISPAGDSNFKSFLSKASTVSTRPNCFKL